MPPKSVPPSIREMSFSCPHCGTYAHQYWYNLFSERLEKDSLPFRPDPDVVTGSKNQIATSTEKDEAYRWYEFVNRVHNDELFLSDFFKGRYSGSAVANLHVSRCYTCDGLAVWAADNQIYPPPVAIDVLPNADLDDDIKRDYNEAGRILNESPRGAAALLRLCIQKLCRQLGESGENINDDIASLVKKGLNPQIQRALDIVRVVGNEAVHPGQLDLRDDRATALKLFGLVNLTADSLISHPKRVEEMYEGLLPEDKRKAIEARDKPKLG